VPSLRASLIQSTVDCPEDGGSMLLETFVFTCQSVRRHS
jgi:hypothetical protein